MVRFCTVDVFSTFAEVAGVDSKYNEAEIDQLNDEKKLDDFMEEKFKDDVFGYESRLERETFIKAVVEKAPFVFVAAELREMYLDYLGVEKKFN